jgi:hypothetical protein
MLLKLLWLRGLIFAVLIPGVVGFVLPLVFELGERRGDGIWDAGWILIAAGPWPISDVCCSS